jgi:hypothetical protein
LKHLLTELFLATTCPFAVGGVSWDGLWYYDASQSHESDHTYVLLKLPNGMWNYDDGASSFPFAPDGRPYPELPGSFTVRVTRMSDRTYDYIEEGYGSVLERHHQELAADGKALRGRVTRIYPDGHEVEHGTLAVRVVGTSGFEGTWKELANGGSSTKTNSASKPATPLTPRRPYWVISTSSDGVMSWYIPATGELIRGKANGQPRPITGPQQCDGTTFVWKQASPYRIEFHASINGQLVESAIETLSPDGKTFSEALWKSGHEDEKDVRVFHKE